MERWELELAESNLRVAESSYSHAMATSADHLVRLGATEKLLRARREMDFARADWRQTELEAACIISSAIGEYLDDLIYRPFLAQAKQSSATFLVGEATGDEDGWTWPVRVMEAGLSHACVAGLEGMPTYFGDEVLPQVAKAVNGARFRRRHPNPGEGEGFHLPELTAGWMSDGRVEGKAVYATAHLLHNQSAIRETLIAAREAGKLDLFGVSVMAAFNFTGKEVGGKVAHVATNLVRFVALDMVAEPGAGGRFLTEN